MRNQIIIEEDWSGLPSERIEGPIPKKNICSYIRPKPVEIPKEYGLSEVGWVFRQLDTRPFYNCYVNELTLKKIKKYLIGRYECDIYPSLETDPIRVGRKMKRLKGYQLIKKIKGDSK